MIRLVVLIVILGVAGSCNRTKDKNFIQDSEAGRQVHILGTLKGGEGKEVLVDEMGAAEFIAVDTFRVGDDGKFSCSFQATHPGFYAFRSASSGYITLIAFPGDTLLLNASWDQTLPYEISGSRPSEEVLRLALAHRKTLDGLAEISRKVREASGQPGFAVLKKDLDRRFDSLITEFHDFSLDLIRTNGSSPVALIALYSEYGPGLPVFNPVEDFPVFELVDSLLYPAFQENEAVTALHVQVGNARAQDDRPQEAAWKTGDMAPAFAGNTAEGKTISLADYRGHYLLLSFWAAWSKPSRDENVYLKKAWETGREKGLKILQVSLDDDRELWLNAIREESLSWDHISDLRRWDSQVAGIYRIDRIPADFLIGPDGKILATDLFGDDLVQKISSLQ
ncbi:MAG: peroxiredoxin family protein [Bacteroidota bacterium]